MERTVWGYRADFTVDRRRIRSVLSTLLIGIAVLLLLSSFISQIPWARGIDPDEIFGNFTLVNKPVPAVPISSGEIPIGNASTYSYNLQGGRKYHIYLTGEWANPTTHLTDYDIHVYKINGVNPVLTSTHTESAGLPEQVSNDGQGRYYIPNEDGHYWFNVRNDAIESQAAESGTLMVIEHIEGNAWYRRYLKGKVNEEPVPDTTWSYEFVSSSDHIRVYVDVPQSLDMYEARLYLMGNPGADKGELVEGIPIAWEPGLRGEVSTIYGGYNLDQQGYRDEDAMASCERMGEDMVIDFEVPVSGTLLYHLALIAEYGYGTIDFMVQTDFDPPILQLVEAPETVEKQEPTRLVVNIQDELSIAETSFSYSTDGGKSWNTLPLTIEQGGNYSVTVPAVERDTLVEYIFQAEDERGNVGEVTGSYAFVPQTDFDSPRLELIDPPVFSESEEPTMLVVNVTDDSLIKEVSFRYSTDDAETWNTASVELEEDGLYSVMVPIVAPGMVIDYVFEAEDDWGNTGTISGTYNTTGRTYLYISLGENEILGGCPILLTGVTHPAEINVTIIYNHEGDYHNYTLISGEGGSFNYSFVPTAMGIWDVHVEYQGDEVYLSASSETLNFTVNPVSPRITCELSTEKVEFKKSVTITGKFSIEQVGVPVKLYYKKDDKITSAIGFTAQDGSYAIEFIPDSKGLWLIQAKVNTDGLVYEGTESEYVGLKVLNPTLTTLLLRLPSGIVQRSGGLLKPPLLYGVIGFVGIAGGGIVFYLRSRE